MDFVYTFSDYEVVSASHKYALCKHTQKNIYDITLRCCNENGNCCLVYVEQTYSSYKKSYVLIGKPIIKAKLIKFDATCETLGLKEMECLDREIDFINENLNVVFDVSEPEPEIADYYDVEFSQKIDLMNDGLGAEGNWSDPTVSPLSVHQPGCEIISSILRSGSPFTTSEIIEEDVLDSNEEKTWSETGLWDFPQIA